MQPRSREEREGEGGCPLKQVEPLDLRLNFRHKLDRRRPRADHRHAFAVQVVAMIPSGRAEPAG